MLLQQAIIRKDVQWISLKCTVCMTLLFPYIMQDTSCQLFLLNNDRNSIWSPQLQCSEETTVGKEELRNSISKEPIYEWEGSQRESLGPITYVTKVKLQHMPCQVRALQDSTSQPSWLDYLYNLEIHYIKLLII